jgi:hypothetical protein
MGAAGKQAVQGRSKIFMVIEITRFITSNSLHNE